MSLTKESNNLAGWPDEVRKFYDENLREKVDAVFKVCKDHSLCCIMAFELRENLPLSFSAYKPYGAQVSAEMDAMFLIGRLGLGEGMLRIGHKMLSEHLNHE